MIHHTASIEFSGTCINCPETQAQAKCLFWDKSTGCLLVPLALSGASVTAILMLPHICTCKKDWRLYTSNKMTLDWEQCSPPFGISWVNDLYQNLPHYGHYRRNRAGSRILSWDCVRKYRFNQSKWHKVDARLDASYVSRFSFRCVAHTLALCCDFVSINISLKQWHDSLSDACDISETCRHTALSHAVYTICQPAGNGVLQESWKNVDKRNSWPGKAELYTDSPLVNPATAICNLGVHYEIIHMFRIASVAAAAGRARQQQYNRCKRYQQHCNDTAQFANFIFTESKSDLCLATSTFFRCFIHDKIILEHLILSHPQNALQHTNTSIYIASTHSRWFTRVTIQV